MAKADADLGSIVVIEGRTYLRGQVPSGTNQGQPFTIAQPLAGRYEVRRFFASGGVGLLLTGQDRRTGADVLIKCILRYDIIPYAKERDREGFTNQLRGPRKTLETERRILVLLRNAGCNAIPHPNDFVFDSNPLLAGPYTTADGAAWTYDDGAAIAAEPYLIMEAINGKSLEEMLTAPLGEMRSLRIMSQVAGVLQVLHQAIPLRPGMTWQLIYQDLKPANILLADQDRVSVVDLGGCQVVNREQRKILLPGALTAGYCPPECEQPFALRTPATDVYTVGSTLFHLLTGRDPRKFLAPGTSQAQAVQLDTRLLEGRCRPATHSLVERCLAPDPAARYPDAAALKQALDEVIKTP